MKLTPQWPQELSASDRAHLKGEIERLNKEMEKKKVRSRFEKLPPPIPPGHHIAPHQKEVASTTALAGMNVASQADKAWAVRV